MAGTDRRKSGVTLGEEGPAIVLVAPQLGENIGTAARAMLNFGLTDLRVVNPRDGWPNSRAVAASAGADIVIDNVRVFETTEEAVADLDYLLATTARPRDMVKLVFTPDRAAARLREAFAGGGKAGVLFGPERTGLHNDDVALADAVLTVPLNPAFSSLNLAQAVLLMSYEWHKAADRTAAETLEMREGRLATKEELLMFYAHLERELDAHGFFRTDDKRPGMVRSIRNLFGRAGMTEQEVRTFRGIVASLVRKVPKGNGPEEG